MPKRFGMTAIELFKEEQRRQFAEYEEELKKHNRITKEDAKELQEILVKTCIDFLKKKDIGDVEDINFSIDDIQHSVRNGEWVPASDSYITTTGKCLHTNGMIGEKILQEYG